MNSMLTVWSSEKSLYGEPFRGEALLSSKLKQEYMQCAMRICGTCTCISLCI